jgi:hypothetical protein
MSPRHHITMQAGNAVLSRVSDVQKPFFPKQAYETSLCRTLLDIMVQLTGNSVKPMIVQGMPI